MTILDGKLVADKILADLKLQIELDLKSDSSLKVPSLDMILVGDDLASSKYVEYKEKAAEKVGIHGKIIRLPKDSTKDEIVNKVHELNNDDGVSGFMVQLPLPDRSMEEDVLESISPSKDADGLTSVNLGRLFQNVKDVAYTAPATSIAVQMLLASYGFDDKFMKSKNVVILGASRIVGLPIASLLTNSGATVTVCNEFTLNESEIARSADILISATGIPKLVKADWVKEGAIVVDVGLSKDPESGKMCGDVDFDNVAPKCSYISKSTGGVGPVTVACLMLNTYTLWKSLKSKN